MGNFLADAEALLAARLERVSLDDIARQAQSNRLHPQLGAITIMLPAILQTQPWPRSLRQ